MTWAIKEASQDPNEYRRELFTRMKLAQVKARSEPTLPTPVVRAAAEVHSPEQPTFGEAVQARLSLIIAASVGLVALIALLWAR